ncbi:hypothetical protein N9Z27_01685 [Alphaproteobacteria bacterium]|nr:hypothetical protein [Alphaproteobacteria bacterium]
MKNFVKIKSLLLVSASAVLCLGAISAFAQDDIFLDATEVSAEPVQNDAVADIPTDISEEGALENIVARQAAGDVSPVGNAQNVKKEEARRLSEYLNLPSLLFTFNEQQAIIDARNTVPPTPPPGVDCEVVDCDDSDDVSEPPPPEARYIRLGGIVFKSNMDWTIWLNKQRVTPTALPEEILDLKVFKEYIEMKWYDDYTKQILPIRIRPHQSFHMDQRIFLPG